MINTGAKLPDAANAVIQIEDTQVHERYPVKKDGSDEKSIRINTTCSINQDIRYVFKEDKIFSIDSSVEILVMMLI